METNDSLTKTGAADIRQIIYPHGGSRIYAEENGTRKLLADGYHDQEFSQALGEFVREYFVKKKNADAMARRRSARPK